MSFTVISLRRINKLYPIPAGAFTALRDIDLEVRAGELVAIVGKSGSGKSTLLNIIAGIDRPSSGAAIVAKSPIHEMGENALSAWRGAKIGFVFQFFQLLPTLTSVENVMLPMDFARTVPPRERRRRALELLARAGVGDQADKLPSGLSDGQLQRVAIARALANEPAVVLADEPTGNLDSETARAVLDLFRGMANAGTTVVIATHERDIAQLVDRKVQIADGRLVSPLGQESAPREGPG